ncbi:transglutaminase TgpA family protein [Coralloluteibacterium thermophilus]|uniref:DUF3488 and DUF4129 domain-containing transglutaminase family protein n=1 Tax=Coralloluteibacterium thermophilum TaxID=2707049 RepID=A0ABV9NFB0_9GAMM
MSTRLPLDAPTRRWCLAAAAACALPLLRLLPAWLALVLAGIGLLGALSAFRWPWPSWLRLIMTLAVAGAVFFAFDFRFGRDTGCALLMSMLALKCGETAQLRDGRSLVGFGLFAAFAAFLQDQGPITLLLAVPAAVLAMAASQRLAEADAGLDGPQGVTPRLRAVGLVMLLALPLAMAGFWLFPRLPSPLWGVPENAIAKTGIDDRMAPGEWIDLMADDSPAFRVRFFGAPPPSGQMYWRGPVLWHFDGRTWSRWEGIAYMASPEVVAAQAPLRYEITQEPTDRRFMFALDLPLAAPDGGRLGLDLSPYADRPLRDVTRYTLESAVPARFEATLSRSSRDMALRLPEGFNPRALELARRWREEAGDDDLAVIQRALDLFNREFTYDLAAPPLGRDSVDEFLFSTRSGFCEHYSSAFAVLMRAAGIPTRVVTGYVGGYRNPLGDYWLVRQSEAHAWNEFWIEGRGWVRADPTAAVAPERILNTVGDMPGTAGAALRPVFDMGDWLRRGWNDLMLGFNAQRQSLILRPVGIEHASAWQVGLVFATVAGLVLAVSLVLMLRERGRPRDPVQRAWRRFVGRFARGPAAKAAHEPALSWGWRAAALHPADADAIRALSARFAAWQYAPAEPDAETARSLVRDLRAFRPRR